MVNTVEFSDRLSLVIKHYGLTASSFAERIGVQRSSISHLLSGRNKPSLDFVLKVLNEFPEVNLYWLMNGTGSFPDSAETKQKKETPPIRQENATLAVKPKMSSTINPTEKNRTDDSQEGKKIERIVVFYSDGTFKNYLP